MTAGAAAFVRREVLTRHGLSSARPDGAIFDEDAVRRMLRNPTGGQTNPAGGTPRSRWSYRSARAGRGRTRRVPGAAAVAAAAAADARPAPDAREVPEARASAPARTTSAPADVASARPKKEKSGSFFSMFKSSKKSGMKLKK